MDRVGAYLELHIEQGPRLESGRDDVGIVTAIVGILSFRARFTGEANHAGNDADGRQAGRPRRRGPRGSGTARTRRRTRDDMTANVGIISVEPGGFNVIPGVCEFTIDVRSPTARGVRPCRAATFARRWRRSRRRRASASISSRRIGSTRVRWSTEPHRDARAGRRERGCELDALDERRGARRNDPRTARTGGDALRPEPGRDQPLPRGADRAGDTASSAPAILDTGGGSGRACLVLIRACVDHHCRTTASSARRR